ncbi:26S Proteasome non-ATPase regulatory subunit 9 [Abortiporus biennis]
MGMMIPNKENPADQVRALMIRKDAIEAEIEAQHSILKANSSTLTTPLVDAEGFPRADIDVWAVRTARVRIIELRNDYKDVLNDIGKALEKVYDPTIPRENATIAPSNSAAESATRPFAKVDGIAPGSPAAAAGLLREDLVLSFGHLTHRNFASSSLQPLAEFVATKENMEIEVKVLRSNDTHTLTFVPRRGWGGRGLLGCHIVPHNP